MCRYYVQEAALVIDTKEEYLISDKISKMQLTHKKEVRGSGQFLHSVNTKN